MNSLNPVSRAGLAVTAGLVTLLTISPASRSAADTFNTSDQGFSFTYPQRWQASDPNGVIRITASDDSVYLLKLDTIETALTASSPINDTGLKQAAAKLAAPLTAGATFVRASSISMDHGQGASFRFKSSSGDTVDVWIALIGKHSAVLTPAKAGQPGQTIGLSVIFQTMAFADALPKQAPRQQPKPEMNQNSSSSPGATTTRTVAYSKQIAPILSERCVACHSNQSASGGFSTASYTAVMFGGSRGAVIKPGNAKGSTLIDYLTGARDQMPKGSAPLSAEQIDLFRTWIREGATNDLDPNSSRGVGAANSAASTTANTTPVKRLRPNAGAGIGRAASRMPKPMESYSGHLASNDTQFDMKVFTNGTVTADWTFDKPSPARFQGTYTLTTGVYNIKMDLVGGSIPGGSKTLRLIMQSTGTDVVGKFSLDTTAPKYKIIALQLAEIDNATKNASTQGMGNGTGTGSGTGAGAGNRRKRGQ